MADAVGSDGEAGPVAGSGRPVKGAASEDAQGPLPEHLRPIRVGTAALPHCLMPNCAAELAYKDSAWRAHFGRVHHDELCLTPNCGGFVAGSCKARCPFLGPDGKSCVGHNGHKRGGIVKKKAGAAMTIESIGRHVLSVHVKVVYRCPLCGLQKEWRESACVRHIRGCAKKQKKT